MEKQETPVLYENKKNVLLTVGRNGTAQKRTDVLLEAFAKAAPQIEGWELRIVGSIEPSFQSYLTEYFTLHPELKDRVFFVGEVLGKLWHRQCGGYGSRLYGDYDGLSGSKRYCGWRTVRSDHSFWRQ